MCLSFVVCTDTIEIKNTKIWGGIVFFKSFDQQISIANLMICLWLWPGQPSIYSIFTRTHSCSQSRAQFLDGGKKLENLRRTHTDPGRTCKLHSKRPQARAHPRNLTDYSLVDNQSSKPKSSSLGSYVADKKNHWHSSTQFRGLCFIHTSRASMSHSHPH